MARTAIEQKCKAVKVTSATAFSTAGYGKVTLIVDITTANGGISASASGTSTSQTNTVGLLNPDGVTTSATYTNATTGQYILSYIGSDDYLKLTFANATVYALLSEPILSK